MSVNRSSASVRITIDEPRASTQAAEPVRVDGAPGARERLFKAFRVLGGSDDEKSAFERTRRWYRDGGAGRCPSSS